MTTGLNQDDLVRKTILKNRVPRMVDLNTDLGQSRDWPTFGQNLEADGDHLLNYVSSVNIPCCVHDAHPVRTLEAIRLAKRYNCVVGAHIGFPDPAHQGYEPMQLSDEELKAWVLVQLGTFKSLLKSEGLDFDHVRPHGAMYAALVEDEAFGLRLAEAIHAYDPWLILVGPTGPVLRKIEAETGLRVAPEVYVGKRYKGNGILHMQRFHEDLPARAASDQAFQVLKEHHLTSLDGQTVPMRFKSLHISPTLTNGAAIAKELVSQLGQALPLAMAVIGPNHWMHDFDDRQDEAPLVYRTD